MSNLKSPLSFGSSHFIVRPVRRDEIDRWRSLMRRHHYLGFECIVGESLYYVVTDNASQWIALFGWGSAALKCTARDKWIGWDQKIQFKRLHLIANNIRFLILPDWHIPNLASPVGIKFKAVELGLAALSWTSCFADRNFCRQHSFYRCLLSGSRLAGAGLNARLFQM